MNIQEEIEQTRNEKWLKQMQKTMDKIEQLVKEEEDTSFENFIICYIELKKKCLKS